MDEFNLDFLKTAPMQTPAEASHCDSPFVHNDLNIRFGKKKNVSKRFEMAKNIARVDELLQEIECLKTQNNELQQQLKDFQKTAQQVHELYDKEKQEHAIIKSNLEKLQQEYQKIDVDLTNKNMVNEQMNARLAEYDGRPIHFNNLVVKYVKIMNKLEGDDILKYSVEKDLVDKLKEYCATMKLKIPPISSPKKYKVRGSKTKTGNASVQCNLLEEITSSKKDCLNCLKKTSMKDQSIQCTSTKCNQATQYISNQNTKQVNNQSSITKRDQASQYISTMITRQTNTEKIVQKHVQTMFPEPQKAPAIDDILKVFTKWSNITPVSPLLESPSRQREETFKSLKNTGTCTMLCNIRRKIDYLPPNNSSSIKQEIITPSASPTPNSIPLTNRTRVSSITDNNPNQFNNTILNLFNSTQNSALGQLSSNAFNELWQIFGKMLLSLLQTSNAGIANNTAQNSAINQQQFLDWLLDLYMNSQPQNTSTTVQTQTVVQTSDSSIAASPLCFDDSSMLSANVVRPQAQKSLPVGTNFPVQEKNQVITTEVLVDNTSIPLNCQQNSTITPLPNLYSSTNLSIEESCSQDSNSMDIEVQQIQIGYNTNKEQQHEHIVSKKLTKNKILDEIQKLIPELKLNKKKRKALKRLLKKTNLRKKSIDTRKKETSKITKQISNNDNEDKQESAVMTEQEKTVDGKQETEQEIAFENQQETLVEVEEETAVDFLKTFVLETPINNETFLETEEISWEQSSSSKDNKNPDKEFNFIKPSDTLPRLKPTSNKRSTTKRRKSKNNKNIENKLHLLFGDSDSELEEQEQQNSKAVIITNINLNKNHSQTIVNNTKNIFDTTLEFNENWRPESITNSTNSIDLEHNYSNNSCHLTLRDVSETQQFSLPVIETPIFENSLETDVRLSIPDLPTPVLRNLENSYFGETFKYAKDFKLIEEEACPTAEIDSPEFSDIENNIAKDLELSSSDDEDVEQTNELPKNFVEENVYSIKGDTANKDGNNLENPLSSTEFGGSFEFKQVTDEATSIIANEMQSLPNLHDCKDYPQQQKNPQRKTTSMELVGHKLSTNEICSLSNSSYLNNKKVVAEELQLKKNFVEITSKTLTETLTNASDSKNDSNFSLPNINDEISLNKVSQLHSPSPEYNNDFEKDLELSSDNESVISEVETMESPKLPENSEDLSKTFSSDGTENDENSEKHDQSFESTDNSERNSEDSYQTFESSNEMETENNQDYNNKLDSKCKTNTRIDIQTLKATEHLKNIEDFAATNKSETVYKVYSLESPEKKVRNFKSLEQEKNVSSPRNSEKKLELKSLQNNSKKEQLDLQKLADISNSNNKPETAHNEVSLESHEKEVYKLKTPGLEDSKNPLRDSENKIKHENRKENSNFKQKLNDSCSKSSSQKDQFNSQNLGKTFESTKPESKHNDDSLESPEKELYNPKKPGHEDSINPLRNPENKRYYESLLENSNFKQKLNDSCSRSSSQKDQLNSSTNDSLINKSLPKDNSLCWSVITISDSSAEESFNSKEISNTSTSIKQLENKNQPTNKKQESLEVSRNSFHKLNDSCSTNGTFIKESETKNNSLVSGESDMEINESDSNETEQLQQSHSDKETSKKNEIKTNILDIKEAANKTTTRGLSSLKLLNLNTSTKSSKNKMELANDSQPKEVEKFKEQNIDNTPTKDLPPRTKQQLSLISEEFNESLLTKDLNSYTPMDGSDEETELMIDEEPEEQITKTPNTSLQSQSSDISNDTLNTSNISTLLDSSIYNAVLTESINPIVDDLLNEGEQKLMNNTLTPDNKPRRGRKRKSETITPEVMQPCKRSQRLQAKQKILEESLNISKTPIELGKYTRTRKNINNLSVNCNSKEDMKKNMGIKMEETFRISKEAKDEEELLKNGFFRERRITEENAENDQDFKTENSLIKENLEKKRVEKIAGILNMSKVPEDEEKRLKMHFFRERKITEENGKELTKKKPQKELDLNKQREEDSIIEDKTNDTNFKTKTFEYKTVNQFKNRRTKENEEHNFFQETQITEETKSPSKDKRQTFVIKKPEQSNNDFHSISNQNLTPNYTDTPTENPDSFTNFVYTDSPQSPPPPLNANNENNSQQIVNIPEERLPQFMPQQNDQSLLDSLINSYRHENHKHILETHKSKERQKQEDILAQFHKHIKAYCYCTMELDADCTSIRLIHKLLAISEDYKLIQMALINVAQNAESSNVPEADLPSIIQEMPPRHLSKCLQRLYPVLRNIISKNSQFYQDLIERIESLLFNSKQTERISLQGNHNLTQLYLMACKLQESIEMPKHPARLFIAKCLYFYINKAPIMIHEVLMWYPTTLPYREDKTYDRSDALISVLQHLLMNTKYEMDKPELHGKLLLSKLRYEYHFEPFKPSLDEVINVLVEKLKNCKFYNISLAFGLLCKRLGAVRTQIIILNQHLMPLANEYYNLAIKTDTYDKRIAVLLEIISMIVKPFPLETNTKIYFKEFARFLNAFERPVIQEAALCSILRLQRFDMAYCYNLLRHFKPTFDLGAHTQAMLNTFIYRRSLTFWKNLKSQNPINFN